EAPKEEAKSDKQAAGKPANDKATDTPATTPSKPAAGAEEVQPKSAAGKSGAGSKTDDLPPGARFTAAKEGIDPAQVEGTGRRGAVTKEDLVNYASGKTAGVSGGARPEERVPMTRIRKRIAERLMQSKNSIAMLTSFNEVNLGKVMAMRKALQDDFTKAN